MRDLRFEAIGLEGAGTDLARRGPGFHFPTHPDIKPHPCTHPVLQTPKPAGRRQDLLNPIRRQDLLNPIRRQDLLNSAMHADFGTVAPKLFVTLVLSEHSEPSAGAWRYCRSI
jgi:hypothetical protein